MLVELTTHKHGGRGMIVSACSNPDNSETIEGLAQNLVGFVNQAVREGASFDDFESGLFQRVLQIGGVAADTFLKAQGNGDLGETIRAEDIVLHRSVTPQPRRLRSIFKEHEFKSFVYSQGAKLKIELRPIDARLSLPEHKASHLFQEISQLFCIEKAFGVGARQFERIFGPKISVAFLEDINREMGAQAHQFLEEQLPASKLSNEGELLVLTADAKGVPLVKADAHRVPAFDQKERPGNRRMATLGCAYTVDRFVRTPEDIVAALFRDPKAQPSGKRPEACNKHYRGYFAYSPPGEEPIPGAIRTWTWLTDEAVNRWRAQQPIIRLMDGQSVLWESANACMDDFLQEHRQANEVVPVIDILDILHVSSYVWKAAKAFHDHKEHQEAFAEERLLKILQGGVVSVVRGLRRMASLHGLAGSRWEEVTKVCNYFEKNAKRMRYDEYLRAGYPIASGVIEGACRHVIKDRMEQGGMRWTLKGAEAMLNLRAINASSEEQKFHVWRKAEETKRVHPHRELVTGYDGFMA
jgi:hypothetical protein